MSVFLGRCMSSNALQVNAFVAPAQETVQAVTGWLAQHNITLEPVSPSGDILRLAVNVDTANALINANYIPSLHPDTGSAVYTTNSYSIPTEMEEHLAFVYPTTKCVQRWLKQIACPAASY